MNQREAVYRAVESVVGEIDSSRPVELTSEQKQQVHEMVVQMFETGEVELRGDRDGEYIRKYVPGLVNNWLRKDPRLNGGTKYIPKNPGSRAGAGDDQLKALKALLVITTDPEARQEIEEAIEARKEELKPKREINVEALPEHLRHLAPTGSES